MKKSKSKSKPALAEIGQAVLELAYEVDERIRLARMRYDAVCTPHHRESRGHVLLGYEDYEALRALTPYAKSVDDFPFQLNTAAYPARLTWVSSQGDTYAVSKDPDRAHVIRFFREVAL